MADITKLYSHQGQEPQELPNKIRLSDGRSRTDASTFTEEELAEIGITGPYERPEYDIEYQRMYWDSESLSYVVEDVSDEELWERVRETRNRLLAESDWTMAADIPESVNVFEWEMYRQRLRELPQTIESPKNVFFPISPEGRSDEDFDAPRLVENKLLHRIRSSEGTIEILVNNMQRISQKVFPEPVGIASTSLDEV